MYSMRRSVLSWISQLLNGMNYIIVSKGVQNICTKEYKKSNFPLNFSKCD